MPLSSSEVVADAIGAPSPRGRGGRTDAILLLADSAPAARALCRRALLNIMMVPGKVRYGRAAPKGDKDGVYERRGVG